MNHLAELASLPSLAVANSDEAHTAYVALRPQRLAQSPNGLLAFLHYGDVQAVLCDPNLKPTGLELLDFAGVTAGPLREMFERLVFNQEGEDHARLRRLVSKAFTPRSIEALRPAVRAKTSELLGVVVRQGCGDLTEDLAKPLAITTLCSLLGVPAQDIGLFQHWAAGMGQAFGLLTPELVPEVEAAAVGMTEYAELLIDRRRRQPNDDLVSALVQAEAEGSRLSTPELVATVANLLFAGYDTTYRQITLGILCLARSKPTRGRLAADPSLAPGVVEEVLRLEPIAHSTVRLVVSDTCVNGIDLAAGTLVEPMIGAANRDPAVFADPDRLDPERTEARALSFGQGMHHCLGAALARLQLTEALSAIAVQLTGWEIDAATPDWYPLTEPFRGLASLAVRRPG
jgi:cytochrome P450